MKVILASAFLAVTTTQSDAFTLDLDKHIICTSSVVNETIVFKIDPEAVFKDGVPATVETSSGYNGLADWVPDAGMSLNLDTNELSLNPQIFFKFETATDRYHIVLFESMSALLYKGEKTTKSFRNLPPTDTSVACGSD